MGKKKKKHNPVKHTLDSTKLMTAEIMGHNLAWQMAGALAPNIPMGGGAVMTRAATMGTSLTGIRSVVHSGSGLIGMTNEMFSSLDKTTKKEVKKK